MDTFERLTCIERSRRRRRQGAVGVSQQTQRGEHGAGKGGEGVGKLGCVACRGRHLCEEREVFLVDHGEGRVMLRVVDDMQLGRQ